jgi:DNA-binding beta-propeller fold protein YncE
MKKLYILPFLILFLGACKSDKPKTNVEEEIKLENGHSLLIVNEGNFQWGNASLSVYNDKSDAINNEVFKNKNNRPLGDVAQSVFIDNDRIYVVVNNSSKIEVINANTFESIATINGLQSPRYFQIIANNRALVTDLYANKISVLNLTDNQIVGDIYLKGKTERMLKVGEKVFVSNIESDKLYWINENSLTLDSITLTYAPNSYAIDKNNFLWVLCSGKSSESILPKLYKVDIQNMQILENINIAQQTPIPNHLLIDNLGENLFFLQNDVFKINLANASNPPVKLIESNGKNLYALSINPKNNQLYVSDALDYVQKGDVYRYSENGTLLNKFKAGIIPSHIYIIE